MSEPISRHIAQAEPLDLSANSASEPAVGAHGPITTLLKTDLTSAIKSGDAVAKSALRMAISALQNAEVAGETVRALTESEEQAVLVREVKTRRESADTYTTAGRPELAAKETAEADFLARYLPQALTAEELAAMVDASVSALTAERGAPPTMKDMGALVRAVNQQATGRADGAAVAALVKARLAP